MLTECVEDADPVWKVLVARLCALFEEVVALGECSCLPDKVVAVVGTSLLTSGFIMVDVGRTAVVVRQWL